MPTKRQRQAAQSDSPGAASLIRVLVLRFMQPGTYKKACVLLTSFVWEFEHAISKLAGVSDEVGQTALPR